MKKITIILISCLAIILIATITGIRQTTATAQQGDIPGKVGLEYLQYLKNQQWDEAYSLTTEEFRSKIPISAFSLDIESSHFPEGLQSFDIGNLVIESDMAKLLIPIVYFDMAESKSVKSLYPLTLKKEGGFWRVDPNWEDFLSAKLEVQEPLAVYQYNGVTISLKYVLLYTDANLAHLRVDISNYSDRTLYWELPTLVTSDSYIKDLATGNTFLPLLGSGARYTQGDKFELSEREGAPYLLTAAPGTEGSIFLNFELLPETVKQLDMVLSGFSFGESGESWSANFANVSLRFDIAPIHQSPASE